MSIIVRTAGIGFAGVPEDWDRNRTDIELAPPAIKDLGKAICAFVPLGINNRTLMARDCTTLELDICKDIQDEIESRKTLVMQPFLQQQRIAEQDVATSEANLQAAKQAKNQTQIAAFTAEVAANRTHHANLVNFCDQRRNALDGLHWPHSTPGRLRTRFRKQAICSAGTGFSPSKGYVMTAGHVMEDFDRWGAYKIIYNLRTSRNVPRQVGYVSGNAVDTELWTMNFEPHEPGHEISRLVLRELPYMPLANFDVHTCHDNDVAIVELASDPRSPFPDDILPLTAAPPPLATPVYSVGHPQALPLKYVSSAPNAPNQPHITGPTGVHPWGISPSCITADLDKFGGMSGGPLFAVGSNEVIGIGRSGAKSSSRPMPADTLQADLHNWQVQSVQQLCIILGTKRGRPLPPPPVPMLPAEFHYNFKNYRYNRTLDCFTVLQNLPTDPAITLQNAWNRVDTYRAFTRPMAEFLSTPGRRLQVVVSLDVTCNFDLDGILADIQFDRSTQSHPLCEYSYAQRGSRKLNGNDYHFEWQRDFSDQGDVEDTALPWSVVAGLPRSMLRSPVFRSPNGLMGWEKVHIPLDPTLFKKVGDRVINISGSMEVSFGYEHAVPDNALQFKIDLDFPMPRDPKHWIGLIGEHAVRFKNGQNIGFRSEGNPWKGPWPGASLPIVQRPQPQAVVAQSIAQIQAMGMAAATGVNP